MEEIRGFENKKDLKNRWGVDGAVGDPVCDMKDCHEWATNRIDDCWVCYQHRYTYFPAQIKE